MGFLGTVGTTVTRGPGGEIVFELRRLRLIEVLEEERFGKRGRSPGLVQSSLDNSNGSVHNLAFDVEDFFL